MFLIMSKPTKLAECNDKDPKSFPSVNLPKDNIDFANQCPFTCVYDDCNKSYTRLSHLKRHEATHEDSYRCTEKNCEKIFKTKFTLKKHVDNIHLKKNPKKYKCSVCDQEFNKHSWLTRHQYRHTGVKPYVCSKEGCEKRFLVPSKLKRHLKTHEGYTCSKENCGQKFPTWTFYVSHVKTSHPTMHKCQNCEKEFATSSNLKAHSEVHNLERDVYLCPKPNCSRFYFMKRNLTHHLKAYHEKRPFLCTETNCYKAFKSKEELDAHTAHHDPKKRSRKKKKSNSKLSFAAKLAGCVPKKILPLPKVIKHKNTDVSSKDRSDRDILLTSPERETDNVANPSPDISNQCMLHIDSDTNKDNMPLINAHKKVKKKKNNLRPSFAAKLAGCVPRKILPPPKVIEHKNTDVSSEDKNNEDILSASHERKTDNLPHPSPDRNNQCIPHIDSDTNKNNMHCLITVDNNVTVTTMDVEIQGILNMKETVLEEKSMDQPNTIECISV